IDGVGIALFAVAMLSLLVFLQNIGIALIWMPVVAVAVGAAFVWWERRVDDPFIDVRVLTTSIPLLLTFVRSLLTATVSYTFVYGFTQWL
ncbi:hypothetical protein ABTK11_20325, partial [Acinetobacter baumannii]